ncbi:MgtC/SapB family protein [Vagococcus acidifermentans]|uniref:Magnesium transporter MgtC n=1 Tax=Vagococcus acidifermentans TaxID=564710 RepID=A0A430B0P2_9ENTE|nr:MgtC/SapB family protein [Vagococcus acidifermentans]RSU13811.1 magnesium transporter MgtC [Vagococcus acidifermentans]
MSRISSIDIISRLFLAIIISGIIGFDREYKNRPAGIRTHILVCVGATIIALIQEQISLNALAQVTSRPELTAALRADPSRLIAQVVSGIGFLGAGTIIVTKQSVRGLTTAASLWAVACLGIAVGMGFYAISIIGFVSIVLVLSVLKKVITIPSMKNLEIRFVHRLETKEFITTYFEEQQVEIKDVVFDVDLSEDFRIYTNVYTIELPKGKNYADIIEDLSKNKNVLKIRLINA